MPFFLTLRASKPLSEKREGDGIWDVVHDAKTHKLFEGTPVIDLKFKLVTAEVEKLLENEHLEKDSADQSSCALHCSCAPEHSPGQEVGEMIPMGLNQPVA